MLKKLIENFNVESLFLRRAFRSACAIFIATLIYRYYSLTQGFWVPLTTVIVMQATTAATLRKGFQRVIGTVIGIILGSLLAIKVKNPHAVDILLVCSFFITYYMKAFNLVNYGVFVVPLSFAIVFLVSALVPQEADALIWARLYDTTIGAFIGVLMTLLLLPSSIRPEFNKGIKNILDTSQAYFSAIIENLLQKPDSQQHLEQLCQQYEKCLTNNRLIFADSRYELSLQRKNRLMHQRFLELTEKMGQFLFSLQHLVQHKLPSSELKKFNFFVENKSVNFHDFSYILDKLEKLEKIDSVENQHFTASLILDIIGYQECLKNLQKLLQNDFMIKT